MAIISGCSGYGGLDEAVQAATGGQVVAHIEYDDAPSKILEHHYPGVPNYHDVTKVDWQEMAGEVIPEGWDLCLTAGYPCQPFSSAGKRRGTEDERHLWPYFAEGIRQLHPRLVVFENVRNHLNLGFDEVLASLDELGYDTTWTLLKASDVGAPHGRARLFIVGRARRTVAAPARTPLARTDGAGGWVEPGESLFGDVEWAGKIPVTGRVVDGAMYPLVLPELTAAALHAANPLEERLLPTPDAGVFNDGQEVDVYLARKERERAKAYNGNGGGTPLAMAVRLLPDGSGAPADIEGGPVFKTPTAQLGVNGGSQHPDKRKEGGHGPTLADELEHLLPGSQTAGDCEHPGDLLPTPRATDWSGPGWHGNGGQDLRTIAAWQLGGDDQEHNRAVPDNIARLHDQTAALASGVPAIAGPVFHTPDTVPEAPNASSNTRSRPAGLGNQVAALQLLPTPTAFDSHLDEARAPTDAEGWEAYKADRRSRGIATGQGILADAAGRIAAGHADQLLPSPTAPLASGGQKSRSGARQDELLLSGLAEAATAGELGADKVLPTPTARDWKGVTNPVGRERDGRPRTLGDELLPDVVGRLGACEHPGRLLPTPEASDGSGGRVSTEEGGQRASGAKRAITLATALHHGVEVTEVIGHEGLLPTPTAQTFGSQKAARPGKTVHSLDTMARHGMLEGAELPVEQPVEQPVDGGLFPTPRATRGGSSTETAYLLESGGAVRNPHAPKRGGELLPTPTAWQQGGDADTDHRHLLPMAAQRITSAQPVEGPLLPTPTCQDGSNTGGPSQFDRNSVPLNALATTLLPTPGTLDHIEKRTTHAGGNPTLQGALGGTSEADLERHRRAGRLAIDQGDEGMLLPTPKASDGEKGGPNQRGSSGDLMLPSAVTALAPPDVQRTLPTPTAMDALGSRNATAYRSEGAGPHNTGTTLTDVAWQAAGVDGPASEPPPYTPVTDWGPYAAAVRRWEAVVGPAPAPTEPNKQGKQRLAPAFPEWMMGLPRGWVTEVPGVTRNEQLKAIGNGVCPQQGYVAITRQLAAIGW